MPPTSEDEALHQLQHEQSKLLDIIDELRTIGVGGLVELPQLIVCGNQSSGKSSVLEAISRVRFPAKSNVCTRFATEVILRRSAVSKIKISIEPGTSCLFNIERAKHLRSFTNEGYSDGNDLPDLIEEAKRHMGIAEGQNSGFSDDILKVEISGPDKPELTLVDLPGLYISTSQQQGKEGIAITRNLTEKYMMNARSIILAVIGAKTDYHHQQVLNISEGYDSERERTLGIITQPDILEAGSEEEDSYLAFLRNEKTHLQLGWHALKNRSFQTRDVPDSDRDQQEKDFFNKGRWSTISREFVGVDSLRRRLSSILFKHIQRNIPDLISDIRKKISDREQTLARLGPSRSTLPQQRGFLLNISSAFERVMTQALSGMYADEFFGGMGEMKSSNDNRLLRATIRRLNDFFSEAMAIRGSRRILGGSTLPPRSVGNPYMIGWSPKVIQREKLEEESADLARRNRGAELPGVANQLLVGRLFRDQSRPWEEVARNHLITVWDAARYFVHELLQHLADEHTSSLLAGSVIEGKLERMREDLLAKLDELTLYNRTGHPLPLGTAFLTQIQKARSDRLLESLKSKLSSPDQSATSFSMTAIEHSIADMEKSHDEFAAADIVAIITFVNNVATLAIENCLVQPLQRMITSQVINDMDDKQIQELAAEPSYVGEERERLGKELNRLQAGLRTFNVYRPMTLPSRNIIPQKPSTASLNNSNAAVPVTAAQAVNRKSKPMPSTWKTPEQGSMFGNAPTFTTPMFSNSPSPGLKETKKAGQASIETPVTNVPNPDQKDSNPSLLTPDSSDLSGGKANSKDKAPKGFGFFSSPESTKWSSSNTGSGFGSSDNQFGLAPGTTSSTFGTGAFGSSASNNRGGFGSSGTPFGFPISTMTSGSGTVPSGSPASNNRSDSGSRTSTGGGLIGEGFGHATASNGKKIRVNLPKGADTSPGESGNPLPPSTKAIHW
ncbi:hypothetical protein ASPVEDRAFT_78461 [Aspergillus versicolor CBS 583.65]|uniref:GED domain-containing protein n=1 Tax=Aspergillus versicolor CBS 583.65 TaxID=1036611 RepID=A0A1L9P5H8_ASPVE|nr:uncharacterized protein ASPVEDRAFT_78461 [Aspergillus versicolor CBS 583.65]OJI96704.1 hypothetical protein ASPVEDRAFT_78461 [Aspergillus versicolor CBS 583.65]